MAEVLWFAWSFADVPGDGQDFDGRKVAEAWLEENLPVRFITRGHLLMAVPKPVEKGPPEEKTSHVMSDQLHLFDCDGLDFPRTAELQYPKCVSSPKRFLIEQCWDCKNDKAGCLRQHFYTFLTYELISRTSKDEKWQSCYHPPNVCITPFLGAWIHWIYDRLIRWYQMGSPEIVSFARLKPLSQMK